MVISRHHMFGAEIEERDEMNARHLLDVSLVAQRNGMGEGRLDPGERKRSGEQEHGRAARATPPPARRGR